MIAPILRQGYEGLIATQSDWIIAHPWAAILVIAGCLAAVLSPMMWAPEVAGDPDDRRALEAARKIEQMMPAPGPERLTFEQKDGMLRELIVEWCLAGKPIDDEAIRYHYALTKEQCRQFLEWCRGQARNIGGEDYIAIVERGMECRWIRFRCVGCPSRCDAALLHQGFEGQSAERIEGSRS